MESEMSNFCLFCNTEVGRRSVRIVMAHTIMRTTAGNDERYKTKSAHPECAEKAVQRREIEKKSLNDGQTEYTWKKPTPPEIPVA
jgi:hypothetical protein